MLMMIDSAKNTRNKTARELLLFRGRAGRGLEIDQDQGQPEQAGGDRERAEVTRRA